MVKLDTETQVKLLHSEQFYLYCAQVKKKGKWKCTELLQSGCGSVISGLGSMLPCAGESWEEALIRSWTAEEAAGPALWNDSFQVVCSASWCIPGFSPRFEKVVGDFQSFLTSQPSVYLCEGVLASLRIFPEFHWLWEHLALFIPELIIVYMSLKALKCHFTSFHQAVPPQNKNEVFLY